MCRYSGQKQLSFLVSWQNQVLSKGDLLECWQVGQAGWRKATSLMDRVGSSKLFLQLAAYQFLLAIHVVTKINRRCSVKRLKPFYFLWVASTVTHTSGTSRLQNCSMNFTVILISYLLSECIWVCNPKTSASVRSWLFKIVSLSLGHCGSWSQWRCLKLYFWAWMQGIWGHRIFFAIGISFCVLSPCYTINFWALLTNRSIFHNLLCMQAFSSWRWKALGRIAEGF